MSAKLNSLHITLAFIMLGSTLGFLYHNFYPATIFSGDSGSMFQGFMIATISLLGFKTATMVSFFVPILILGIPILDTLFAIIRRAIKHQPIYLPDKSHLHHQLLKLGLSHRNTVLAIYAYRLTKEDNTKNWLIFGIASLMSIYLHYYGLMAAGIINVILLVYLIIKKRKKVIIINTIF